MQIAHSEISDKIIKAFYEVYNELGHGFLESVYEQAMFLVLCEKGLSVVRQAPVPVWFKDKKIGSFVADMIVENLIIVELKATKHLGSSHEAQLLNYLRATELEIGLLMNFGEKAEFKRRMFDNKRKHIRENPRPSAAIFFEE